MRTEFYLSFVKHSRFFPKKYNFNYRFFWTKFDIDELNELDSKFFFFSRNRFNLISFYDRDHFNLGHQDTRKNIEAFFSENGIHEEILKIELVTNPRILGYTFNPVSFYFIETTNNPYAIIAIGNTFNEQKPYLLRPELKKDNEWIFTTKKEFYISPFISVENSMTFKIRRTVDTLIINIDDHHKNGELELRASYSGKRLEWNSKNILKLFFSYPLITFRIIFSIHYHALRLFMMKIPYFKKSDEADLQKNLFVRKNGSFIRES